MTNENNQKQADIEEVLNEYETDLTVLTEEKDAIVANFLKKAKEKQINQIRKSLKNYDS